MDSNYKGKYFFSISMQNYEIFFDNVMGKGLKAKGQRNPRKSVQSVKSVY